MKVWYEAIGLAAGPILPPVAPVPPGKAEEIAARLTEIGVI